MIDQATNQNQATSNTDDESKANEANRNLRVRQLAEEASDAFARLIGKLEDMNIDLGVPPKEISELVLGNCDVDHRSLFYALWAALWPVADGLASFSPMRRAIARLFENAAKLKDGSGRVVLGQAPAVEAQVILRSGTTMAGSLSPSPEGALRLGTGGQHPTTKRPVLAETIFDYEDVQAVTTLVDVDVRGAGPSIITATH